jgi:Tol biopolymer transport system component
MTATAHRLLVRRELASLSAGVILPFLLIPALSAWDEQRAAVPASELRLSAVPYRIVYESLRETGGRLNWEIFIVNADGSGMTNLTNTPDIDEHYPHASPDGARLLFVAIERSGRQISSRAAWVMNLDGSGRTKVADNAYQPTWTGDGRAVAYLPGEFSRLSASMTSNRGLVIHDLATKTPRRHTDNGLRMLYNLTGSPDGQWFVATTRQGRDSNILVSASSGAVRPLSVDGCRPDISPDGTRIAWGRTDHELRIGAFNPSSSRNVTDQKPVVAVGRSEKIYHVDWSPDGRYLAFSHGSSRGNQAVGERAAGWNLAVYDIAAAKWAHITTDGHHNKEPDWVPVR